MHQYFYKFKEILYLHKAIEKHGPIYASIYLAS